MSTLSEGQYLVEFYWDIIWGIHMECRRFYNAFRGIPIIWNASSVMSSIMFSNVEKYQLLANNCNQRSHFSLIYQYQYNWGIISVRTMAHKWPLLNPKSHLFRISLILCGEYVQEPYECRQRCSTTLPGEGLQVLWYHHEFSAFYSIYFRW